MNFGTLLKKPSAYLPLVLSLAALATVVVATVFGANSPPPGVRPDEGAAAHIFQLLMVAQLPFMLFFVMRWLRSSVTPALQILLLQVVAAVFALAPVFLLHL